MTFNRIWVNEYLMLMAERIGSLRFPQVDVVVYIQSPPAVEFLDALPPRRRKPRSRADKVARYQ